MKRFLRDTRGANLVEYIILVGVIALMSIAAFKAYQFKVRGKVVEQAKTVGGINAGSGNLAPQAGRGRPSNGPARRCLRPTHRAPAKARSAALAALAAPPAGLRAPVAGG